MNSPLTAEEKKRLELLWEEKRTLDSELFVAAQAVKSARHRHTLLNRRFKRVREEWLALIERDHKAKGLA